MPDFLILKTGSTLPSILATEGDFEAWFVRALPAGLSTRVVNVAEGEQPPAPGEFAGVLVTGSPAMVSHREPWSEASALWLRALVEQGVPVLGICYGHQLLAHAFGGRVDYHPGGREIGTHEVRLNDNAASDALFKGMSARFMAHLSHRQSVLELPNEAVHLGSSDHDANQAFRIGERAWGVQFHPEFSVEVMSAYLDAQSEALRAEGLDYPALVSAVKETADALMIIREFAALATGHSSLR